MCNPDEFETKICYQNASFYLNRKYIAEWDEVIFKAVAYAHKWCSDTIL